MAPPSHNIFVSPGVLSYREARRGGDRLYQFAAKLRKNLLVKYDEKRDRARFLSGFLLCELRPPKNYAPAAGHVAKSFAPVVSPRDERALLSE